MSRAPWLAVTLATAILLAGCSSSSHLAAAQSAQPSPSNATPTFVASPTPTFANPTPTSANPVPTTASRAGTQCPAVQPAPVFAPSAASSGRYALVTVSGTTDFVVRDITDINHPFTVSSLGSQVDYASRFVNGGELSSTSDQSIGLVRMPFSGSPKTVVSACGSSPSAWSPDGTSAAYIRGTGNIQVQDFHIVSGGQDRLIESMNSGFASGCESRACADRWDFRLLYSPNGQYISYVQQPAPVLRIWTSAGKLIKSVDGSPATMSVWSGTTLYWRDDKGVETWRDGVETLLLPGVSWIRPKASPAGGQIVYETRDANYTTAHVFVLDTTTGKAREIAQSRSEPTFLDSRDIWYEGERPCAAPDPCFSATVASGAYIFDLQTSTEYGSIITNVWDVWPHAA